jgi:hypothetical protein
LRGEMAISRGCRNGMARNSSRRSVLASGGVHCRLGLRTTMGPSIKCGARAETGTYTGAGDPVFSSPA